MKKFGKKNFNITGIIFFIPILLILQFNGCSEQSTDPDEDQNTFSFNVKVVDDNNNPIQGIMVGSHYYPSYTLPKEKRSSNFLNPMAATTIKFSINQQSIADLTVYDLENINVKKIIDNQTLQAGVYAVIFDATGLKGSVYKIKLNIKDTLNQNILFTDSIYSALLHLDPASCKIGITNSTGNFITNDKTYFPSLYTLPDLIRTGEGDPTPLGIFSITDQITIQLTDTLSNITKVFTKTIGKNKNEFILKFSEGTNAMYKNDVVESIIPKNNVQSIFPKINRYWSLEQSYPNPFN